jgi:Icc-related predicted phosphoesterase
MLIPFIEQNDNTWKAEFLGVERTLHNDEEVSKLQEQIRDSGHYYFKTTRKEMDELDNNPTKVDEIFSEVMQDRLRSWIQMAEDRLKGTQIRCCITPGNDDRMAVDSVFEEPWERVANPEGKVVMVDDSHEMISTGYANMTPWNCPRDIPDAELAKRIDAMTAKVQNMQNCIFNFHCPPYDSGLDSAPKLDETLRPVLEGGGMVMVPVGSPAVRKSIDQHQPLLGLHGHIHEARAARKIGRTLCLNPGSEYGEGILRGAVINLEKDRVKGHVLTGG